MVYDMDCSKDYNDKKMKTLKQKGMSFKPIDEEVRVALGVVFGIFLFYNILSFI